MDTMVSQEDLQRVFDKITREVTEKMAGIRLYQGEASPGEDCCTVYASFERGFHSSLSLCVDRSVFTRLTRHIMQQEEVTSEDVEDFTKEYFNVLCGRIASRLFQETKIASRFEVPSFFEGSYQPDDHGKHFTLNYFTDQNENAQLTHHVQLNKL